MMTLRHILVSLLLFVALAALAVNGAQAATMMSDQSVAMVDGGMADGMSDCDGCAGNDEARSVCTIFCGAACAGDLGHVSDRSVGRLAVSSAVIVPAAILRPDAALALEPPRPKIRSL